MYLNYVDLTFWWTRGCSQALTLFVLLGQMTGLLRRCQTLKTIDRLFDLLMAIVATNVPRRTSSPS